MVKEWNFFHTLDLSFDGRLVKYSQFGQKVSDIFKHVQ